MKQNLKYLLLAVFLAVVNSLIFLILHVLWGEAISALARQGAENEDLRVLIVFGGFLLASIISIVASYVLSLQIKDLYIHPLHALHAVGLALLTNLVLWVAVGYIKTTQLYGNLLVYPEESRLLPYLVKRGGMFLGAIPRILTITGVYISPSLPIFWLLSNITFISYYLLYLSILR
jgi:hypothetical protein